MKKYNKPSLKAEKGGNVYKYVACRCSGVTSVC
jgi:hypothetical protein